jgi:hypothetical protein
VKINIKSNYAPTNEDVEIHNIKLRAFVADTQSYGTAFFFKAATERPTWIILSEKLPKGVDTVSGSFIVRNVREATLEEVSIHLV